MRPARPDPVAPRTPRGPVRRLPPPPRVVRWKTSAQVLRVLGWVLCAGTVALVAIVVPRLLTSPRAASELAAGGVLTTARVVGVEDRAPEMRFHYTAEGMARSRTIELSDADAARWQDALVEGRRRASEPFASFPARDTGFPPDLPIHVRVPAGAPDSGVPLLAATPRDVPFTPLATGVVLGTVSEVTLRHRVVSTAVEGTEPPVTFTRTIEPGVDASVGTTSDMVYRPPYPEWNVRGPPGSLFPSPFQRYGIPAALGVALLAGVVWPLERRRRRRQRLLALGVERPVRILESDVSPGHGILDGFVTLAQIALSMFARMHASDTPYEPPVRRRFSLRVDDETRELTRSAPAALPIPKAPGGYASVVCDPDDPWNPIFVDELLALMTVEGAAGPSTQDA